MKDQLNYTEYGSACCGATVRDPGGTDEGFCADCGEHTSVHYIQEVDIAILNFMDPKYRIHIHRIEYDSESSDYESLDDCVTLFLEEEYGCLNNLEYMYDEVGPIKIKDHRKEVDILDD